MVDRKFDYDPESTASRASRSCVQMLCAALEMLRARGIGDSRIGIDVPDGSRSMSVTVDGKIAYAITFKNIPGSTSVEICGEWVQGFDRA